MDLRLVPLPPPPDPSDEDIKPKPYVTCNRTNRQARPCERPAGWGTVHPGTGACKLHGGATPYGISSAILHSELADQVEEYANNPKLLDLKVIVAKMQAVADFFMVGDEGREIPPQYEKAMQALSQATAAIKTMNDILYSRRMAVSVDEMHTILSDIATIIREELAGYPDVQERIARRLTERISRVAPPVIEG